MNKLILFIAALAIGVVANAQGNKKAVYDAMANLVGGEWNVNGAGVDGSPFNQQVTFEWGAGQAFFTSTTKGIVNKDTKATGVLSHGVRAWDKTTNSMKFWEFDTFGDITEGSVVIDGNDIYFIYEYQGKIVTDAWVQKNKNTYEYIVGVRSGGKWTDVFINGGITRK